MTLDDVEREIVALIDLYSGRGDEEMVGALLVDLQVYREASLGGAGWVQ